MALAEQKVIMSLETLPMLRAGMEHYAKMFPAADQDIKIQTRHGEVRCLIYKAKTETAAPVFFDVHGGGFILGNPEMDEPICRRISNELNITAISIDYTLSPEAKYPRAHEEVYDVIEYVYSHSNEFNINPEKMALGGHSAGGNVTAVVSRRIKEAGKFKLCCQVLDYPAMSLDIPEDCTQDARDAAGDVDFCSKCYCVEEDKSDPYCMPAYAKPEDLRDLPPAIMITCEIDSLCHGGEQYANLLIAAGVEVTIKRFLNTPHGFTLDPTNPRTKEAFDMMIEGVAKYLK